MPLESGLRDVESGINDALLNVALTGHDCNLLIHNISMKKAQHQEPISKRKGDMADCLLDLYTIDGDRQGALLSRRVASEDYHMRWYFEKSYKTSVALGSKRMPLLCATSIAAVDTLSTSQSEYSYTDVGFLM